MIDIPLFFKRLCLLCGLSLRQCNLLSLRFRCLKWIKSSWKKKILFSTHNKHWKLKQGHTVSIHKQNVSLTENIFWGLTYRKNISVLYPLYSSNIKLYFANDIWTHNTRFVIILTMFQHWFLTNKLLRQCP